MASKRHLRRRSCEGKVRHASAAAAQLAAGKLRKTHDGGAWAAYRCQFCGAWHVGRQSAQQRQATHARREAAAE